jgi:hypothetical protein
VLGMLDRFDQVGGVIRGLAHVGGDRASCECPAFSSRRVPGERGSWL